MAWMKLDDKFHSSRKVNSIPKRHRFQAVGLWAIAGSWVAGEQTDGFVPERVIDVEHRLSSTYGVECEATPQVVEHRTGSDHIPFWSQQKGTGYDLS